MLTRLLLFTALIMGMVLSIHAQSFQWIKQIGDKRSDDRPICKILPDGQSVIAWRYVEFTKIDTFKTFAKGYINPYLLAFLNKDGKAKWIWKPDSCYSVITISAISYSQNLSKIYVCGNFNKGAIINKTDYKGSFNNFVMRLDTNGNFEKIYNLSIDTGGAYFESMDITKNNEIVLGVYYGHNNTFPNTKLNIPEIGYSINKTGGFILKLDKDLKPQKSSDPMYGNKLGKLLINIQSDNKIINTCSYTDTLTVNGKNYFNGKNILSAYITQMDSNLKIKKISLIYTTKFTFTYISSLKSFKDGSIVIGGWFQDSISLVSKRFNGTVPLFVCLDSNFKLKWVKTPIIKSGKGISAPIYDIEISGDYIFGGGQFIGDAVFDDFNLPDSLGIFWFFKTDSRGNILWMRRVAYANPPNTQNLTSISANNKKEILLAGFIKDTVRLNNQKFFSGSSSSDILLMKIRDIEIYRGYVKSGPYCAGDTIKIPYTKDGNFNSGNEFIAQLSDEEGNFKGKERELGRLKSTDSGMIKGVLPLFEVESSPHYRIRIISTNPVVQSYYKADTLRLLIYSKDKANAGLPETICIGDSIQLKTYGGTKWTWSPKYNMNDSTLKKPIVWPTITTTYKIIIADSSGCGKIDTAYKIIRVRNPLMAKTAFTDTSLCDAFPIKILAAFEGGDSTNYQWQWFRLTKSKKTWKQLDSSKLYLNDTLAYTPQVTLYTNDTLAITL